ncbi:CHASE2 domain-containing protein [Nostoc sp. UHCC 0702]|nr:CHASE2 domain-containing protein [Nostoc sp. UHCC 0702]
MKRTTFHLHVTKIKTVCQFELQTQGQKITEQIDYPASLTKSYEDWQKAYLNYYRHLRDKKTLNHLQRQELTDAHLRGWKAINKNLRGKKLISGGGNTPVDYNRQLRDTETQLLHEFQRWLLSPDLVNIRSEIANAARKLSNENQSVEVFLTCTPVELARLPWETWQIGTDLGIPEKIHIYRTPATIRNQPVHYVHRKIRILAIIGYDTHLNFETDKQEVESLKSIAEVKFVGWNTEATKVLNQANAIELKTQIFHAINDQRGWDVLFFAGHSNETILTGGELGIAPNVSLAIQDIQEALKKAQQRGLQFAIFNSCSGINIAESLINLGLSQVIVMREPIHNQVARKFLMQFLHSLAEYKDVYEALLDACQYLKQQVTRFSFPSAYLIPSLYRHPDAELFRIKPFGFRSLIKRWFPTRQEIKWLSVLLFISLLPPLQDFLLEPRILLQAVYRQLSFQVPQKVDAPIVLLQIDNKSLKQDNIEQRSPLDYSYLAKLIQKLSESNAKLIGIDYVLNETDIQPENTQKLSQTIRDAINKKTWFIFAYDNDTDFKEDKASEQVVSYKWRIDGDIRFLPGYVELLPNNSNVLPFSYIIYLSYLLNQSNSPNIPQPDLQNSTPFQNSIWEYLNNNNTTFWQRDRLLPITLSSQKFLQEWFRPILDFSIPPDRAYNKISACELLNSCSTSKMNLLKNLDQQIVILAPGGYREAGVTKQGEDNQSKPLAIAFWNGWGNGKFTGGEAHAYMVHHLLKQRLVIPVPDFLMILLAALLAKSITVIVLGNPSYRKRLIINLWVGVGIYVIISLQVYFSAAILLPWFLPTVTFWHYIRSALRRNSSG